MCVVTENILYNLKQSKKQMNMRNHVDSSIWCILYFGVNLGFEI